MDQRASIHDMLPLEPACLHQTSSLPLLPTLPTVAQRGWGVGDVVIKILLTPGAEPADQALTSVWWMRSSVLPSWRPRVIAPGQSVNSAKQPMPIWLPKHLPFVTNLETGIWTTSWMLRFLAFWMCRFKSLCFFFISESAVFSQGK